MKLPTKGQILARRYRQHGKAHLRLAVAAVEQDLLRRGFRGPSARVCILL